jgi:NAD(P)-dependent dehydrogenase (short-subunit alcohol dehydrogenase family)
MKGKTVIITGGASGIGKAAAVLFAYAGANVIISDIDKLQGDLLVEKIVSKGGIATFYKTDVANPQQMEALVQ